MVRWLALVLAIAACQGGDSPPSLAEKNTEAKHPAPAPTVDAPAAEPKDPIDELGAIPAWQAVVDRAKYLERRGQHGVVFGVLGAPVTITAAGSGSGSAASPYTWLVDDTEGNGSLAIRVLLGKKQLTLKEGDRVALGGAWALDEIRHWFWKVDNAQVLGPQPAPKEGAPGAKDATAQPGHALTVGDFPSGVKRVSLAKDGDLAYFQVVGLPPTVDGDGWPVADELGNPVAALLVLPGERASYGGQDMRTPDERWQLRRGQTYWVRIGRTHKRGPDKPPVLYARTAPIWVK
jgi:hypothetical protein